MFKRIVNNPWWALIAAFGTYFCMYGYRKPYTAASFTDLSIMGINYKVLLIICQTLGYVVAKWAGIKFVSEIKRHHRIKAIVAMIALAELMLLFYAWSNTGWGLLFIFLNGLSLGVIFGLVLRFLEGRKTTEFLIAGLCASFIVSDGASKSVGAWLIASGVSEQWMPFMAGAVFALPIAVFITMLSQVPPPTETDIEQRSERKSMTKADRIQFVHKYLPGLAGIFMLYLLVTLLRSVRSDFAVEIWKGLGYKQTPDVFTRSEIFVAIGAIAIIAAAVYIKNHQQAFSFAFYISTAGLILILVSERLLDTGIHPLQFMIMAGVGVYLPYVAVHAVIFERLIAITREKANVGFLMYIADSVGYTGYILLMLFRYLHSSQADMLPLFRQICIMLSSASIMITLLTYLYFIFKLNPNGKGFNKKFIRKRSNF